MELRGTCEASQAIWELLSAPSGGLEVSGTSIQDGTVNAVNVDGAGSLTVFGNQNADLNVVAGDITSEGGFVHIDAHGSPTAYPQCKFWWMIIPSS